MCVCVCVGVGVCPLPAIKFDTVTASAIRNASSINYIGHDLHSVSHIFFIVKIINVRLFIKKLFKFAVKIPLDSLNKGPSSLSKSFTQGHNCISDLTIF